MPALIRFTKDTASNFTSLNEIYQSGTPLFETDTNILKIGDGTTAYSSLLPIFGQDLSSTADVEFNSVTTNTLNITTLSATNLTSSTLDTGQGANELYAMDQNVRTTDAVTFVSVNTGQGANELYAMDQNVRTTDDVTFNTITTSTINTGQGANKLYVMNQNVRTTDDVTFGSITTAGIESSSGLTVSSGVTSIIGDIKLNNVEIKDTTIIQNYEDTWLNKTSRQIGTNLRKIGCLIPVGNSGEIDDDSCESPCVWFDINRHKYRMVYTAYKKLSATPGDIEASVGAAESDDLITWVKIGQKFTKSGTSGTNDEYGTTGPVIWYENGTYYLFYIGLDAAGYEGGTPAIMLAKTTNSALTGWSRVDTMIEHDITKSWRASKVWHVSIVKRNDIYYMFFNATNSDSNENIGYATATNIEGPWTVDDINSPVVDHSISDFDSVLAGDPCVYYANGIWYMSYFGYNGTSAADGFAWTTDDLFPLGWVKYADNPVLLPTIGTHDEDFAHKPYIYYSDGVHYHYYTSVDADGGSGGSSGTELRQISLAIDDGFDWRGGRYKTPYGQDLLIGDPIDASTAINRTKIVFSNIDANTEVIMGQGKLNNLIVGWSYNATPGSAYGSINTYSGNNSLKIQEDGGDTIFGGAVMLVGSTPASASATGVAGTITWDSSYIYVCTATNTWKRASIATW